MRFFLHLCLPGFYVLDLPASERPQVVTMGKRVLDTDARARAAGVETGMHIKTARALAEGLRLHPWREDQTRERADRWRDALLEYVDEIETEMPHTATVDLSAHPNPASLLPRMRKSVEKTSGLQAQLGWGDRPFLARLHALCNLTSLNWDLAAVELIDLWPSEWHERLRALGCSTLGDVRRVPEAVIRMQFGADWRVIHDVAQRTWPAPLRANYPPGALHGQWRFEGGVEDTEVLRSGIQNLAREMGARLVNRQQQGEELRLTLEFEHGPETFARVFAKPIHHPLSLASALLRLLPSEIRCPVESVRVSLLRLESVRAPQSDLSGQLGKEWREHSADQAVRELRQTFGESILSRGPSAPPPRRQRVLRSWEHALGL
jgi:nucleotidyltransferase/DNA polymerase involved in DNA repair